MRKSIYRVFCGLCLLSITINAWGFQNEPDGFRGIKWGTKLKDIKQLVFFMSINDKDTAYTKSNDDMSIAELPAKDIYYCFFDNVFYGTQIRVSGYDRFTLLKGLLEAKYGTPQNRNDISNTYFWKGNVSEVYYTFSLNDLEGFLFIQNKNGKEERADYFKTKTMEEKAKKGF